MIQFPCLYLHYNTVLMIVNFGSENLVPDVGSGFFPFPIFSNTTGSFGLKVDEHISLSDSIKTTKYLKNLKQNRL